MAGNPEEPLTPRRLTLKQQLFVEGYLTTGNGVQSGTAPIP